MGKKMNGKFQVFVSDDVGLAQGDDDDELNCVEDLTVWQIYVNNKKHTHRCMDLFFFFWVPWALWAGNENEKEKFTH